MAGQQKNAGLAALLVLVLMVWSSPAKDHKDPSVASATDATTPATVPQQRPIRVEVPLVLVNVSVIDPYNRFVTGLDKGHFEIYEDRKPQKIMHFSTEDVPISVGLLFDASGSMSDKIDKSRMAVAQ